ncbi:MAG TPA: glutamine--fructose-6-phosphate transaminase (isomerizing), partial [bacterium]|nr:glutamine--fructose-6-phosphate transaminase (isomerizing) [bacterium]
MCGIIGYIGKKENPKIGIEALKRLEYRGYDSAGIAVFNPKKNKIFFLKTIGKISVLEKEFKKQAILGSPFILHTRWGTHGKITQENAHPHFDCNKNIFLVHNGIVENFVELKKDLIKKGHKFISETDTEVISHLIEDFMNKNLKLEEAVRKALKLIRGSYALAIISKDDPQKIIAASLSSPLTIGVNKDEYFLASDSTALAPFTKKIINLEDNEIAVLTKNDFYILKEKATQPLEIKSEKNNKQGYPHFMLKEIMEQPQSLEDSINGRIILDKGLAKLGGLESVQKELKKIKKLNIIACGSSYYTGLISKYIIEEYAKIPVEVDFASEFRYRKPVLDKKTAFLMISQSGETADTIATLKDINKKGILTLAIVNVVGSTISRESTAGIYNHIGPEIGVASTKSFTSQLAILDLLMLFLSRERDITKSEGKKIAKNLSEVPELVKRILKKSSQI